MINSLYVYRTDCKDPFINLAREEVLLKSGPSDGVLLYLWQNEKTVVIGRNQNAFKECRVSLLDDEGGRLARRLSGGGAVFHDSGNLNFTFILPREDFDIKRQADVICRACRSFGIDAVVSGRNDLEIGGRKFSGNAFYKSGDRAYHHGTLLVSADMNLIGRYLKPPEAKLKAKGVDSVHSRVINLFDVAPEITKAALCRELVCSAESVYGFSAKEFIFTPDMENEVSGKTNYYASDEWRFGSDTTATFCCEETFGWGTVTFEFQIDYGMISRVRVFTDAMDWEIPARIESALCGKRFTGTDIKESLISAEIDAGIKNDLCKMLEKQEI